MTEFAEIFAACGCLVFAFFMEVRDVIRETQAPRRVSAAKR